jgi:quercetin dioxygenase-like cupin family protein
MRVAILVMTCSMAMAPVLHAQKAMSHPMSRNVSDLQFGAFPGMPTCSEGAVVDGDPSKGPSIVLAKLRAGCVFPWHWHTATENLMLVSGTAHVQASDGPDMPLTAGGFASMPSKHVHKFRCDTDCTLYVHSDAAFDMHYVNAEGSELTPEEALKAVKETAAK